MSIKIMSKVWEIDYLDIKEKMVLLALADSANDDGICWPKNTTLQKKCSLSSTPLGRCLKILTDVGLISYKRRSHLSKGGKSNLYEIKYSDFYTGRKTELIRLSREKYKRKSSSILHGSKNINRKAFKGDISTRVETNYKGLSQEDNNGCTDFDLQSECDSIVNELDNSKTLSQSLGSVKEGEK